MSAEIDAGLPVLETGHVLKNPNFAPLNVLNALPSYVASEELIQLIRDGLNTSAIPFSTMFSEMFLIGTRDAMKYPENFEKGYAARRPLESSCAETKPVIGYCTWEMFANKVAENLDRIEELVDLFCLQTEAVRKKHGDTFDHVFLYDDGLIEDQSVTGVLREGVDSSRIDGMVAKLKSNEIQPGFWFSPIKIYPESDIERQHPDWLVKDEAGENVTYGFWDCGVMEDKLVAKNIPQFLRNSFRSSQLVLDITKPEVQTMQLNRIKAMYDLGFRYLKMDFLYMMYNKAVEDPEKVDLAFESFIGKIREACPDLRLMACSSPSHLVHLFEDARIGLDLAPSLAKEAGKKFPPNQARLLDALLKILNSKNYSNVLRSFLPKAALPAHPDFNALITPEHGLDDFQVGLLHQLMKFVNKVSLRKVNLILGDDLNIVKPDQILQVISNIYGSE